MLEWLDQEKLAPALPVLKIACTIGGFALLAIGGYQVLRGFRAFRALASGSVLLPLLPLIQVCLAWPSAPLWLYRTAAALAWLCPMLILLAAYWIYLGGNVRWTTYATEDSVSRMPLEEDP